MNDKRPEYGVVLRNCLVPSISKGRTPPQGDRTLLLGAVVKIEGEVGTSRWGFMERSRVLRQVD